MSRFESLRLSWLTLLGVFVIGWGPAPLIAEPPPPANVARPSPGAAEAVEAALERIERAAKQATEAEAAAKTVNSAEPAVGREATIPLPRGELDRDRDAAEARLRGDVRLLASDRFEGRGPRTRGLDLAAEHIASEFAAAGLQVDVIGGEPFQVFHSWESFRLSAGNQVAFVSARLRRILTLGEEVTPLSPSGQGPFDLPLAFAGYGISDPQSGYDDYAGIDVTGRAVIVLRQEPPTPDGRPTEHRLLAKKLQTAVERGALGVIFCTDADAFDKQRPVTDELLPASLPKVRPPGRRLGVWHCQRQAVDSVLKAAGRPSLSELESQIDADNRPQSFLIDDCRLDAMVVFNHNKQTLRNVIGVLPGQGELQDQTIVIGAHYDHLGRGGFGSLAGVSAIHNGADDNASGTAGLLELARQFGRQSDDAPRRRLVFIAFSGEEMGLLGSAHYVRSPIYPLNQTAAMVNLDMVGRLRKNRLVVYGTGTARSFPTLIAELGRKHEFDLRIEPGGAGPSDHASFHARGVPVLHLFTGLHEHYHRPSDDAETLEYGGLARIVDLTADIVQQLSSDPNLLEERVRRSAPADALAAQALLARRIARPLAPAPPGSLGVLIRPSAEPAGLTIVRLLPDSAVAGKIRPGDVLLQIDGQPCETADELRQLLRARKPEAPLSVLLRRGEFELELSLELQAVAGE